MKCAQPFMRDTSGRIRWSTKMSEEEKLNCTPFPCGCCLPCRINKARTWQHRIILESRSHDKNAFVTLTYSDDSVPVNDSGDLILDKKDLQKYLKRLRKTVDEKVRYFAVGEYGDKTDRPHYHLCLFGLGQEDEDVIRDKWSKKREEIGIVHVGSITPFSARYIAGYTIKKLTKSGDPRLGGRTPEFMLSSRKDGGIGKQEVLRIASLLKQNPYFDNDQILRQFTIGGKEFPLGGYLTNILLDALEVSEERKKEVLLEWQEKIFKENDSHQRDYYFNIIENSKNYRLKLDKKHKIYSKEKTL